ncbi:MAG: recombinase family protein, partial [Acetobacteraceae bacterium]|nr:recombinase family protein [Acetobacteraceae bacterium]
VFDLFERRRSAHGVLQYLADHDIQLPDRVRFGPHKGEIRWNRPSHATVGDMLRHPAYAGAVRPELPRPQHTWAPAA